MKVFKFGGTSAGNASRMKNIGRILHQEGQVFVVLSAMSGTTDTLESINRHFKSGEVQQALSNINKLYRDYQQTLVELFETEDKSSTNYLEEAFNTMKKIVTGDYDILLGNTILAFGERLSTYILNRMLQLNGEQSALLDATKLIWLQENGEAHVENIRHQLNKILKAHPKTRIFITQGFICSDNRGKISNLGRGGSDYSATLFGAALKAEEIQIWTDIDGVQNNDPRYVNSTMPVRQLHFDEAAELAYFGAKILHPQCVLPAQRKGIPVLLKNTLKPTDPGTQVSEIEMGKGFKAVAARDNITAIRIKSSRMLNAYGFLRKVFEIFEEFKTPIDMITTSEVAVSITIDNKQYLSQIVERLKEFGHVEVEGNKTIVGVVGHIDADDPGYAMRLFAALSNISIRMISYGASSHNISFLINTDDKVATLKALHAGLFQS